MTKIVIRDVDKGFLAFDLRELLRALAPRSLTAAWTISSPHGSSFEATGSGGIRLETLTQSSSTIGGYELLALADDTVQVIWGDFVGRLASSPREEWITIRAVDSSFYEIESLDETAIAHVASEFRDVRFVYNTR